MSSTISFYSLFSREEVCAAFAVMDHSRLFDGVSSVFRFKPRRCAVSGDAVPKTELSVPLCRLRDRTARLDVPPPLLRISDGLTFAAMDYARRALRAAVPPSVREEVLDDVWRRSVFRLWRYRRGCGCRAHGDPGLCTALLRASSPGLELEVQCGAPLSAPPPERTGRVNPCDLSGSAETNGWEAPRPTRADSDALVLASEMMGVVSRGAIPAVRHRVRSDWADMRSGDDGNATEWNGERRYSLVVELRPANPRRWYTWSES